MMGKQETLGDLELLVMLAVMHAEPEAYAVPVRREIERRTGRGMSRGAVYVTLERLEKKGLLASALEEPVAERGGKARRYYRPTRRGVAAVRHAHAVHEAMVAGLEPVLERGH